MRAGDVATCTILVDNLGPSDARNVVVTDTHVSDGSFTILERERQPRRAPARPLGGVVTCNLGTEPAGGRTTITVTETATEAQDINDCASVVERHAGSESLRTTRRATASTSSPSPI